MDLTTALMTAVGALTAANVAQWRNAVTLRADARIARQEEKDACARRVEELALRVAGLEGEVTRLRNADEAWRDRWIREVERNVALARAPAAFRPPAPPWEEDPEVRALRANVEAAAVRKASPPPLPQRRRP